MTNTPAQSFEVVRRGYEPSQVDRHVQALQRELENHKRRADEAERQARSLQAEEPAEKGSPFAGLGARIEQILGLAEEEAHGLRGAANDEASQHRALAEQDADKVRKEADRYAQERRADAETEAQRILQDAKKRADTLRDDSDLYA
jgi:cell division septum initiation protein DivIVA